MSLFKKLFSREKKTNNATEIESVAAEQPARVTSQASSTGSKSTFVIGENDVFVQQQLTDKAEAIQFISQKMLENGYVSADYTKALMAREEQVSTYLLNGVAIPHGVKEAKELVIKTGIVIVQFPNGIAWGNDEVVHLAVGIAAMGDEHLAVLSKLTRVVMDKELSKKLGTTATADEIIKALGA